MAISEEQKKKIEEEQYRKKVYARLNRKKWHEKWWVIVLLLPIFLLIWATRLIWRQKWEKKYRIAAIVVLWGFIIVQGVISDNKNAKLQASHVAQPKWECVGPDGKHIGLSREDCDEFNNSWKNGSTKQTNTATFDVSSLVGKDLDGVIAILGQPKGIDPTALQIQQGVTEWDKTFVKDGKELLVTYTISDRKIVDFFIPANDPTGVTSDKEALLKQENLNQDDPKYKVEFVKAIKDPNTFTGVKVIQNQ